MDQRLRPDGRARGNVGDVRAPDKPRGDTAFYTMLDPFAYLSATQALDKKPLEYAAGDKFSLSYLLTVYSANKTREFIQSRCERWEKERN